MTDLEIVHIAHQHKNCCFLCRWIIQDYEANGKLTGAPNDYVGTGTFPRSGKEKHAQLESGITV